MGSYRVRSIARHLVNSIRCYRLTALYLVAGVALTTADIPFTYTRPPAAQEKDANQAISGMPILPRFRLDIGEPPSSIYRIAHITIAGWFSFLGAFWDVRRRRKEWALIRLYGGYPSLVAGFQYFCLSLLGALIGAGFALLTGPSRSLDDTCWLMLATLGWGFFFSSCVCIGPIAYTEFCDIVAVLRIEG